MLIAILGILNFSSSSTASLHQAQHRSTQHRHGTCQSVSKQTSSGCIITDLALVLAPTGRAEMCVYQWFSKSICNGVRYFMAQSFVDVKMTGRTEQQFCRLLTRLQNHFQWIGRCKLRFLSLHSSDTLFISRCDISCTHLRILLSLSCCQGDYRYRVLKLIMASTF